MKLKKMLFVSFVIAVVFSGYRAYGIEQELYGLVYRGEQQVERIYRESTRKIDLRLSEEEQLVPRLSTKEQRDVDCDVYCGEGYFFDHPGERNDGDELVCIKYPLACGAACTTGWKYQYLVKGTNYTCQLALQDAQKVSAQKEETAKDEAAQKSSESKK